MSLSYLVSEFKKHSELCLYYQELIISKDKALNKHTRKSEFGKVSEIISPLDPRADQLELIVRSNVL